jgi:predicted metal-dependent hydrolase
MSAELTIGDLAITVIRKQVKNIHLSVKPPLGAVSITAPIHVSDNSVRAFAIGKLSWIKAQQLKLQAQLRERPREYLERESHYVWGRRCLLRIIDQDAAPFVELGHNRLQLFIRSSATAEQRAEVLERWYRDQLREAALPLTAHWQEKMNVQMSKLFVQRMKTRWGSCNPVRGFVRLNTDLAKKPPECLEYILVHELTHLLEPTHSGRFVSLMDRFLPSWQHRRDQLNQLPVRHVDWEY